MIQEIHARHKQMEELPRDVINLKEYAGGLRDIEMFLLICRAVFKIKEHSNFKLLRLLAGLVPSHSALFNELYNHYELLRKVRNLNRLMIAARDDVDCQTVNSLYTNLLHQNQETRSDPVPLFERLVQCMSSVMVDVDTLLDELILPLIK
jgi:UTP:GlnB (protein PII) uridylyltransferase